MSTAPESTTAWQNRTPNSSIHLTNRSPISSQSQDATQPWNNQNRSWGDVNAPQFYSESTNATQTQRCRGPRRNENNLKKCYRCGKEGHFKRECVKIVNGNPPPTESGTRLGTIGAALRSPEIYVNAIVAGKPVTCLLDTGCERSIIGRKLIPNYNMDYTNLNLYAANGTSIPVVGALQLAFTIDGNPVRANVVVTEALEELILGID